VDFFCTLFLVKILFITTNTMSALAEEPHLIKEERPSWCTCDGIAYLQWTMNRKYVDWRTVLDVAFSGVESTLQGITTLSIINKLTLLSRTGVTRRTFGDCMGVMANGRIGTTPAFAVFSLFYLHAIHRSDRTYQLLRADSLVGWLLIGHTTSAREFEADFDKYFVEQCEIVYCNGDDDDSAVVRQFSDEDAILAPSNFHGNMSNFFPSTHETYANYFTAGATHNNQIRLTSSSSSSKSSVRRTLTVVEHFYYLAMCAHHFIGPGDIPLAFNVELMKEDVYNAFKRHCQASAMSTGTSIAVPCDSIFWRTMITMCPDLRRKRKGSYYSSNRANIAQFPPLDKCRERWLEEHDGWNFN